jgi:hypothetical protein
MPFLSFVAGAMAAAEILKLGPRGWVTKGVSGLCIR